MSFSTYDDDEVIGDAPGFDTGDDDEEVTGPVASIYKTAYSRGVNPDFLIGLAKLETRMGEASVKGDSDSYNLFNIKDMTGKGPRAHDKAEGSRDAYRQYASYDDSANDLVDMLARKYPKALEAQTPEQFATALKQGGYATDPDYVNKVVSTINSVKRYDKPATDDAPEGMPNHVNLRALDAQMDARSAQAAPPTKTPSTERTWREVATDTGRSLTQGAVDVVGVLPGVAYGALTGDYDNAWLNTARGMNEVIQDEKSAGIKARQSEMDKKLSNADGFTQKIVAGFVEGLADPTLLADTLARSVPGMVAGGGVGRLAGAGADALGMTALKTAAAQSGVISQGLTVASAAPRVAGATAVGTSAIVQGSSVAADAYEAAMKQPIENFRAIPEFEQLAQERGEEQAKSILAGKAATRAGMVATAASLVAQKAVPGGDSIEKMFLPSTMREVADTVVKTGSLTKGMAGGVASQAAELGLQGAKVGLKESASEGAEEGFGAVAKDLELSRLGKDVNLSDSFATAAGQGAAAGFAMGNVAGIRETAATKSEAIAAEGARLREMAAQRQADITKAGTVDEAIKAAADAQDYTSQSIANQILQMESRQETTTHQAPEFTSQPQPAKLGTEATAVAAGPTFNATNIESIINGTQADQAIESKPQEAPAEAAGSGQSAYPNQLDSGIKAEAAAQAQAAQDAGIRAEVARMREIMEARRQAEQQAAIEAMPNTSPAKQVTATSGTPVVEAPVKDLKLSTDVPQFKSDAGTNGVVDKLDGKYDRALAAPIQVWQRTDGSMEVISGRHRLDLAQRSGEQTVPVQVHREVDGFTAAHATLLDTELNVKDGRGKVKDYVRYFQSISIERGEATQRGLLQTAIGRDAYTIANAGSDELIASHNASQLTDQAATQIAQAAPKNGALQAVGMRMVLDGKSTTQAVNTMAAVKLMAQERGGAETEDMFGFDDSSMRDAQTMAKIAGQEQAKVSNTLAAVRGAAKRPELAAKEGVNINDQAALAGRIQSLEKQKSEWSNWATNPELVAQIRSQMEPKSQSQPATTPASNAPTGAPVSPATESAPEIGIPGAVWSRGNGRIAGHYAVKVDGEVVGNYHEKPEAAVAEAKTFLANKEARAKDAANKDAAIGEIRTRLMDGGNATDNDIRRLGLRDGSSELKWFIPAAANAFGITSRAVRPYIKDLIRVGHTDMGTKIESVNPKKALQAIAAAIKPTQKSSTGTITEPAFDLTPTTPEQVKADEDRAASAVKAEAIAKQDSENKFKADAEVDDFRLTGSDRAVDVAEAAGQGSLFDAPTDAPTQAPTIEAALAHVDSDSTLNTLEKAKARAALRKGDIEPGDILPKAQESTSAPTQEVNNVDQNQGAIESAPSYKYTPAQKIDAPSVGAFNSANEHKANAFQRVKMLRQQVADGRTDRRVELIRAEHEHRSAILGVEQAKAQIEKDANKQGLTTIKPIQKSSTDAITEPPLTTRQTVRDAIAESLPKQARAVDRMLQRGEEGKRGGLVVIEANTPEAIAKAYSEKTGRDYDASLASIRASIRGKNEGMANQDDVVGNTQGGRSADDSTRGTIAKLLEEQIQLKEQLALLPEFSWAWRNAQGKERGIRRKLAELSGNLVVKPSDDALNAEYSSPEDVPKDVRAWIQKNTGILTSDASDAVRWGRITNTLQDKRYPSGDITIYRAASDGAEIRAGDWVTTDRKYAEMHLNRYFDGRGNLLETTVDGRDVLVSPTGNYEEAIYAPLSLSGPIENDSTAPTIDGAQLRMSSDGKIQGFHDPQSGLSFVVAPNVTARTAAAVALHEAYHGQQRDAIDTKAQALLDSADDKLHTKGTREVLAEARQKIADAGETGNKGEAAAYIIEAAAQRGREAGFSAVDGKFMDWVDKHIGQRVGGIIRDFVSMVRAHSLRIGLPINLHVDDLVAYAKIGLERAAEGKTGQGYGITRSMANQDDVVGNKGGRSADDSTPSVVNKAEMPKERDGFTRLYHAGSDPTKGGYFSVVPTGGVFDGMFASVGDWGNYGTGAQYFSDIPSDKVLSQHDLDYDIDYQEVKSALEKSFRFDESDFDTVWEAVIDDKSHKVDDDDMLRIFNSDSIGESSWEAQRIRGRVAKALGYQAVEMDDENGTSYLIVSGTPLTRVLSKNESPAPDSGGAHDRIRFSRSGGTNTPPAQQQPAAPASPTWDYEGSKADKLIYELQDGRIDLKRVQESIKRSGQDINEKFDARLAETLYAGRVATRTDRFLQDDVAPLLEQMARSKVTMPELSDYLLARHAPERNAQIAKVNDKMPDGGAGTNSQGVRMTTQAATDYIANLPTETRLKMQALAQKVDAITKGTRDLLVSEGLEKQETIDAWNAAYKHYAPLFREDVDDGRPHSVGTGFSVRGDSSKRATGSDKKVDNMLAHVLMQREAAITRAEKNRVAMSLYGLALSSPNKDFWTTITPKDQKQRIMGELVAMGVDPVVAEQGMSGIPTTRTVDKVTGKVVDRINPLYKSLPGAITVRVNGEDRVLMFNQKDPNALRLAESLKNLDGLTKFDLAGTIVSKTTRWISAANTQYNPAFGLVNSTRDSLGALVNLSTTPIKGKQLQVFGNMPSATAGIYSALRGDTSGQWAKLYEQFQMDGGQTGYKEMFKDVDARAKAIEKELSGYDKGALSPGKAAHAVLSVLDGFNTIGENVVRLSAYKTALDNGLSRPEAAKLARELTVDFNRKGRMGRELGPLYAFFNASVQGTSRTLESLKGPAGAKIIAGGIGLGVLQAVMLAAAGYDDDEVADWVKSRNFIIPLGKTESGEKKHIQIPLPLGLNALPNIGRTMVELGRSGGKDFGKKTVSAIGEVMASLNPVGAGTVFTPEGGVDWGGVVKTAVPTILDPVVELATNKGFSGTAIEKTYRDEADSRPGFQRAKEKTKRTPTGQMYLGITKALNNLTGGDDYEAGFISPSPEKIRYLAEAIGGGLLREIEKAVDLSMKVPGQKETKPSGIPFIGRFYGETDSDAVAQSRYYKSADKAKSAETSINLAKAAGDGEAMKRIYEKRPEAKTIPLMNRVQPKLATLNKLAVSQINDSENIKLIDDARMQWMKATNKAILELEAQ